MNRIDICKNIIQSITEYITNPDKLELQITLKRNASSASAERLFHF